jgi:hypothetical protein
MPRNPAASQIGTPLLVATVNANGQTITFDERVPNFRLDKALDKVWGAIGKSLIVLDRG